MCSPKLWLFWNRSNINSSALPLPLTVCACHFDKRHRIHIETDLNASRSSFMFDQIMPLSEAKEGYDLFDKMKVQKVVFTP